MRRIPGLEWEVEYVTVPIADLFCPYPNPGGADAPPTGLMGSLGWPENAAGGRRIIELAAALQEGLTTGTADLTNPSFSRVIDFRTAGAGFILSRPQLLAVIECMGNWCVREGMHRTVALALLGVADVEAMNLPTIRQPAA